MLELVRREDEEVLKIRKEYLETEAELARIRHASEVEGKTREDSSRGRRFRSGLVALPTESGRHLICSPISPREAP
jgi:hypothetical protein